MSETPSCRFRSFVSWGPSLSYGTLANGFSNAERLCHWMTLEQTEHQLFWQRKHCALSGGHDPLNDRRTSSKILQFGWCKPKVFLWDKTNPFFACDQESKARNRSQEDGPGPREAWLNVLQLSPPLLLCSLLDPFNIIIVTSNSNESTTRCKAGFYGPAQN